MKLCQLFFHQCCRGRRVFRGDLLTTTQAEAHNQLKTTFLQVAMEVHISATLG